MTCTLPFLLLTAQDKVVRDSWMEKINFKNCCCLIAAKNQKISRQLIHTRRCSWTWDWMCLCICFQMHPQCVFSSQCCVWFSLKHLTAQGNRASGTQILQPFHLPSLGTCCLTGFQTYRSFQLIDNLVAHLCCLHN